MRNIKIKYEYDGTDFFGMQKQEKARTVAGEIEKILNVILKEKINLINSGIDSFFAFNKYDWMLESGDNICSIPSVSGEDRILQAMIAAFFLLTPLIILILRKLFMREMFEFWVYVFSLGICLVCGWWLFWGRFIFCY